MSHFKTNFFYNVTLSFTTDDTFSVGNYIKGNLTVHTVKPFNIEELGAISLIEGSTIPALDSNNTKLIEHELNLLDHSGGFIHLWHFHNMTDNSYSYIVNFGATPTSESTIILIGIAKICDNNFENCIWIHTPTYNYPTIYPYTAKLQAETDRAIQRQALESDTTNNLISGLTLLLAGFVPMGLVIEFWIEYLIENKFYRKEN